MNNSNNISPFYFSQTDDSLGTAIQPQTTSAVSEEARAKYEFNKSPIKFNDASPKEKNDISEETEENFYKKAFGGMNT